MVMISHDPIKDHYSDVMIFFFYHAITRGMRLNYDHLEDAYYRARR